MNFLTNDDYSWNKYITVFILSLVLHGLHFVIKPLTPAPNRILSTFVAFYPKYLREHSLQSTKRMHYLGTFLVILSFIYTPPVFLAIFSAGFFGFAIYPWLQFFSNGLLEAIAVLSAYYYCANHLETKFILAPLFCGYSCAWVGHFFFEKNKPATFIYPIFSLAGDFLMFYEMCIGKIKF